MLQLRSIITLAVLSGSPIRLTELFDLIPNIILTTLNMQVYKKGFTLVELLIVTIIIGVLATIAISMTLKIIEKAHIDSLISDLSAAYKASVLYHTDNPDDAVTLDSLKDYGYNQSEKVTLIVVDGSVDGLRITATHAGVVSIYVVDQSGHVSEQ
jgi:prepilin-type N-terminal cleavage/methylation domain-containing protein